MVPDVAAAAVLTTSCCLVMLAVAQGRELHEANPAGVPVTEVHMVLSSHFDAGCKTPGCTRPEHMTPYEPRVCAKVGAGNAHGATDPFGTGEPWAYHIVNRYFDQFIPQAIALAEAGRRNGTAYSYMTQSWIASLYLDCERAGMLSWPGSGAAKVGSPSLHCPNASSIAAFKAALKRGDIFLHAFPHDGEASYYPDTSLFESALSIAEALAQEIGFDPPISVSQRDVPGWTRASLPLLKAHGIVGLSFGAGTPPGKPDVPPLCVWRDEPSGAEVVLTYETGYGGDSTVFVLPNGVALAVAWQGDNTGPAPLADVAEFYAQVERKYPGAKVSASTFDDFFKVANEPTIKAQLPVVTQEIGDGWIYGVPSDPLKNAQFREASRQRLACVESGSCDVTSAAMRAFDRLLVKVPEHTWGVAQSWFLPDYVNWTNAQFDRARAQQSLGFIADNTHHADYNSTVNSWVEQRLFVTQAPALLEDTYPTLAANLTSALDEIAHPVVPVPTANMKRVNAGEAVQCGDWTLKLGSTGAVVSLVNTATKGATTVDWASEEHPVGQFVYQTFTSGDFSLFLKDFGSRIGDKGVWPNHTLGKFASYTYATSDLGCGNFCKKNMTSADPQHRELSPLLTSAWHQQTTVGAGGCALLTKASLPLDVQTEAGAPAEVVTLLTVTGDTFDWDVVWTDKRPTRLAESIFFSFVPKPAAVAPKGWSLQVLGSHMDPTDTLGEPGSDYLTATYGGSPHLRGVEAARWNGTEGAFVLSSLDVPILCTGRPSPFVSPRTHPPDMSLGVHWNILNNIWNTNYVLWYPFDDADKTTRSRFRLEFGR